MIKLKDYLLNQMNVEEYASLYEAKNFNFRSYLKSILGVISVDEFINLAATSKEDIALGLLPASQIEDLRDVMDTAFRENWSIKRIEKNIRNTIPLKDRYIMDKEEKILALSKEERPLIIARTETIRLANEGALNHFKQNQVEKVQWVAANDNRTCPICQGFNGRVFVINESRGLIPAHSSCRCTWAPVIE